MIHNSKIAVIVGPTASGKSELAVKIAKKFNGEIISADSRQIYKGLNLGTGKVPGKKKFLLNHGRNFKETFVYKNIPHHCINYVNPKKQYSASLFKRDAEKAILDILKRGKLPILCGGTAHWIDAVVYNQILPEVKPNKKLRADLEEKSAAELFKKLTKLDPKRARNIDRFNKRRLIRALEIVIATGKPVPNVSSQYTAYSSTLWLGIKTNQDDLYKKIEKRLKQRLKQGMLTEVKKLRKQGLSWKKLESFGLEYRYISLFLQKKLTYDEMFTQLLYAIKHYSRRQLTWWKRNKEIKWVNNYSEIVNFLS